MTAAATWRVLEFLGIGSRDETRPWTRLRLPADLRRIKSMLSHEEKQYLTWLASEKYEGWGAIVDLGPWLGSSSAALAEGLRRKRANTRVQSFDLFRWDDSYMTRVAAEALEPGADFLPMFMRAVGRYARLIDVHREDLSRYHWSAGPIEILFVDVAKTWDLTNAVLRGFGPALVPGRSRIVLQDFRHHSTHWLPLIFDGRPEAWQEAESVDDGWTASFIPRSGTSFDPDAGFAEEDFPLAEAETIVRSRMKRESLRNQRLLLRSLYRKALISGDADVSSRLRAELLNFGDSIDALREVEDIEVVLVARGWLLYGRQDFAGARSLAERCLRSKVEPSVYVLALMGMSCLKLGNLSEARSFIEQVVRRRPDYLPGRLYRAELAVTEGHPTDAMTEVRDVIDRCGPDDEEVRGHAKLILAQIENTRQSPSRAGATWNS